MAARVQIPASPLKPPKNKDFGGFVVCVHLLTYRVKSQKIVFY